MAVEQPVLVGGTGRCGTTITGRLLGAHPSMVLTNPQELRFVSGRGGVVDTLATTLDWPGPRRDPADAKRVAAKLTKAFFRRRRASGAYSGLSVCMTIDEVASAAARYCQDFDADPLTASRALVLAVVPGAMRGRHDCRWVDTTPANVRVAHHLHRLLPGARFVHMIRDGRDVAASFASKPFGPDDPLEALQAWGQRMLAAGEAEHQLPAGTVIRVDLLDWRANHAGALERLLMFLGEPLDQALLRWFADNVDEAFMQAGRWQREVSPTMAGRLCEDYERWLTILRERFPGQRLPGDPPA